MKTKDAARGKWRGILMQLGIDSKALVNKHGPCPACGGKDRFRFDNKNGDGDFHCSGCGAGNGFDLLQRVHKWDFKRSASEVDAVLGNVSLDAPGKPPMEDQTRRRLLNDLWKSSHPIGMDDPVARYLIRRNLPAPLGGEVRFAARCPLKAGGHGPAMIARVLGPDGVPATIHRTFLTDHGDKIDGEARALMPGAVPPGAAVRLAPAGEVLGIAEGIETALAAQDQFKVPVWAALNSTMMAKWLPPEGVREVIVLGDCDAKYGGQAAAYTLAHRLAINERLGLRSVRVEIPGKVGTDWADRPGIAA